MLLLLSHFSRVQLCATHRQQPARPRHSWDSPDKNTGVGCHFLLQSMKVKSENEVLQSCLTLCDPIDCSLPVSSIHGIFQAKVLEWGAIAFSWKQSIYPSIEELWDILDIIMIKIMLVINKYRYNLLNIINHILISVCYIYYPLHNTSKIFMF